MATEDLVRDVAAGKVDWASLEHAYGSAKNVPELLKQRATKEEVALSKNGQVFDLVGDVLFHQMSVYSATAPALASLVDLALSPATPRRAELAADVVHLVAHAQWGIDKAESAPQWASDIHAVFGLRVPQVVAALSREPDPEVRRMLALAVAVVDGMEQLGPVLADASDARLLQEATYASRSVIPVMEALGIDPFDLYDYDSDDDSYLFDYDDADDADDDDEQVEE